VREIGGEVAWRGADLAGRDEWAYELDGTEVDELRGAVAALESKLVETGRPLRSVARADVSLPRLGPVLAGILDDLLRGRGFALLRGIPVADVTAREAELLALALGVHLGVPIPQNPDDDMLVHVRDEGKLLSEPGVRSYETAAELEYHSDSSDIVGLLCLRPARRGGVSTIVSAVAIHDEMVRTDPEAATLLYDDWWNASPVDDELRPRPICATRDGRLFVHYGRLYIERAHAKGPRRSRPARSGPSTASTSSPGRGSSCSTWTSGPGISSC
jgi:Taurine catabolism dioxygenase TauD, TfdA family